MKRQYKIGYYKRDNERIIYREYDNMVQYLAPGMIWSSNKNSAKRYIYEQDAVSSLSIIKSKGDLKTEEEYIEEVITEKKKKMSWGEL